jgi:amidohydrolase
VHEHCAAAFEEHITADLLASTLRDNGIEVFEGTGQTGVVAVLRNGDGCSIGLRADIDVLTVYEEDTFGSRPKHEGKMHTCGHGGHVSMLLEAALYLNSNRSWTGTVHFIFQPAAEALGGEKITFEEWIFNRFPCDAVYSLHNCPGLPTGSLAFETFEILVDEKSDHAAIPEIGIAPFVIVCRLLSIADACREDRRDTGHSYANPWGLCSKRHSGKSNRRGCR